MRIQILMLGFKGLTYPQFDYCKSHIMALDYWEQLLPTTSVGNE